MSRRSFLQLSASAPSLAMGGVLYYPDEYPNINTLNLVNYNRYKVF
jgi:hypothetical protein